jgi:hypothetical protein
MSTESIEKEVKQLQQRLNALHRRLSEARAKREEPAVKFHESSVPRRVQRRIGRIILAPGFAPTTQVGSIYSTILKVLSENGHLDRHDQYFGSFCKRRTTAGARQLLHRIGTSRSQLEQSVRSNEEFKIHCAKQTVRLNERARAGDAKANQILQNPKICRAGKWVGDLNEAVGVLLVARTIDGVRRGKNVQTLNKAKLMFDAPIIGGEQYCFLYPQKWHAAFNHALALNQ